MDSSSLPLKKSFSVEDAKALGLMCGLEIHQQLEGRKLFCDCPTRIRDEAPHFTISRSLRASAGESGHVDEAALAERRKRKRFLYHGYRDTTCLVELDEEPPSSPSPDALRAAVQASKLFSMGILDQLRFMRKTVIDGSNTSGFQRTGLVATDGTLRTESGLVVRIDTLCLEEDACKKVLSEGDVEVYNLSRLGIPLLEVATAPDITTPLGAFEVAEAIGMTLRSLPSVKRGLGTIRQDVNVSIKEGVRVEIKGAQDLKLLPTIVANEALRQHNILLVFQELRRRGASVQTLDGSFVVHHLKETLKGSSSKVVRDALDKQHGTILAARLDGYAGLLGCELQPGRRYGSELSDHAKLFGVKGLFHSDELPKYGITQEEKDAVYRKLDADPAKDGFILIADDQERAAAAITAALERASDLSLHAEVRNALPEGTSAYLRPMPGASRMYPETDIRPVMLDKDVLAPKLLSERIGELKESLGLSEEDVRRFLRDGIDIARYAQEFPTLKPSTVFDYFYSTPALVKKEHGLDVTPHVLAEKAADALLPLFAQGAMTKNGLVEASALLCKGEAVDFAKYRPVSDKEIDEAIASVLAMQPDAQSNAMMGLVMARLGGKADGKKVRDRLQALQR